MITQRVLDVSLDETIESHSKNAKLSLMSTILLILSFGIGGSFGLITMYLDGEENDNIIRPDVDVDVLPVSKEDCSYGHEVETGYAEYLSDNIPDVLPICLEPSVAEDWWVAFEVRGGYWPCGDQWMWVYQYGDIVSNPCNGMMVGWKLQLMDEYWKDNCWCCTKIYNFSIDTSCNNWVCLDSTSCPDSTDVQKEKLVDIKFVTHWCGCDFYEILADKNQQIKKSKVIDF